MIRLNFILILLFPLVLPARAQQAPAMASARAAALGNTYLSLADPMATFQNVAALAKIQNRQLMADYQLSTAVPGLHRVHAAASAPTRLGQFGIGLSHDGGALYREQELSMGFANQFGIAALGIGLAYRQYYLEGLGYERRLLLRAGGVAHMGRHLQFAMAMENINQASLSELTEAIIPVTLRAGLSWVPSSELRLMVELEQRSDRRLTPYLGTEYQLRDWLWLRLGLRGDLPRLTGGFGLAHKGWFADLSYQQIPGLGAQMRLSLRRSFTKAAS